MLPSDRLMMDALAVKRPSPVDTSVFVHPRALCESNEVGAATRIWAFAHVMQGAVIGAHCNIGDYVFIESGARIGDRVTIKNGALIWYGVTIEDDAFIGPGVTFTNDPYPRSPRMPEAAERYRNGGWCRETRVERGASIGAGAVVCCGLTIGGYAMIGAAALVTRDVPRHRLMMGQPARPAGWVCTCGLRLDDELTCAGCGRAFRESSRELVALPNSRTH